MPGLKLVAELGGDGSGFNAMMNNASGKVRNFGSNVLGPLKAQIAGAFTIGAITALSKKTIDYASHLRDVSDALAVNVEWLQKRANAAKLAGGSEDDLLRFMDTMNRSRAKAVNDPTGAEAQAFGRLGLSSGDITGLSTQDFFDRITKAFGDGANRQTVVDVEKVGGRAAIKLLAAFQEGLDGRDFISESIINQLDEIGDKFDMLGTRLMIDLAPAIVAVSDAITAFINKTKQSGSFWGAVSGSGAGLPDWIKLFANPFLPNKPVEDAFKAGASAAIGEEADQQNAADALAILEKKKAAERKARENSPPGFIPNEEDPKKAKRGGKEIPLSTDALVGVGNFLGQNARLVNTVAEQQLNVQRQQLKETQKTNDKLDKIADKLGGEGTLEIPD